MKYCTKCKKVYLKAEKAEICPLCRKKLISNPAPASPVGIIIANGFELERICAALKDGKIPYSYKQDRSDTGLQILNSAPFENCVIYVPLSDYNQAAEILIGIGALKEEEIPDLDAEQEEFSRLQEQAQQEELPPKKAAMIRALSLFAFFVIVAVVVFLTDRLLDWIKPLLGW